MLILHVGSDDDTKVLLYNQSAAEGYLVRSFLHSIQLRRQNSQSIISRIPNQKSEIDQVVRIRQLAEKVEILAKVRRGVFKRGKDKDSLFIDLCARGRHNVIEVDMLYRCGIDGYGRMVVEQDRRL